MFPVEIFCCYRIEIHHKLSLIVVLCWLICWCFCCARTFSGLQCFVFFILVLLPGIKQAMRKKYENWGVYSSIKFSMASKEKNDGFFWTRKKADSCAELCLFKLLLLRLVALCCGWISPSCLVNMQRINDFLGGAVCNFLSSSWAACYMMYYLKCQKEIVVVVVE